MKASHRKILRELMGYANKLGGSLDGTSTTENKYIDRQRANMHTYTILLAILSDHPDNDNRDHEFELAEEALNKLKELTEKKYPDRNGKY